jgi:integrase
MNHVIDYFGKRQARSLTFSDVDKYRAKRATDTARADKPPAVSTVNREVAMLRQMLNHGVKYEMISSNPLKELRMLPENNMRDVVISRDEFARLLDCAESQLKPILTLAFETGMRKGEILRLKWSQVDFRGRAIRLTANDTKTKQARIVALSPEALEALQGIARSIGGYVFVNPETGKPWNQIKKMFRRAKVKAGLEHIWFHDLRRSFATQWRRDGVPESVIMRMTGHKTNQVFSRYNIVSEDDLHSAVDLVGTRQSRKEGENNESNGKDLERVSISSA